jgi:hypothetical protein
MAFLRRRAETPQSICDYLRTRQLNTILRSHAVPQKFGLLSIDVEGHDKEVLASLDLTEFQPELIVIEAHGADLLSIAQHTITRKLLPFGYTLVAFYAPNLFFRKLS